MKAFREVYSNRNIKILSLTNIIGMFFNMLYMSFWTLFLKQELGFTVPLIALLTTVQGAQNLLFSLPGGVLADRIGRKKVTLIAGATGVINPLIYLLATSWELVFLATIFVAMGSLSMPARTAMVAESLPRDRMGTGYAVYNMANRLPWLFSGAIGGWLMEVMGIGPGTRFCLVGSLIGGIISLSCQYLFLNETLQRSGHRTSLKQDLKEILPMFKGNLKVMMVSSILFQISAALTQGLLILYIIDYPSGPRLTTIEYGLLTTLMSIVSLAMSIPGGTMADRFNRRKLITFGRSLSPITTLTWIYIRNYYLIITFRIIQGVGEGLSGAGGMMMLGGPAWSSLMADVVPMEKRGRVSGLMSTFSGIARLPAPNIGAWMWENPAIGPEGTMWTQLIIGLFSTFLIWRFLKDPVHDVKKIEEPARDNDEDKTQGRSS